MLFRKISLPLHSTNNKKLKTAITMKKAFLLMTVALLAVALSAEAADKSQYQLSNKNATREAQQVFDILKELYGTHVISGTVADVDWNIREAENVYKWTGRWPALNVFDFMTIHASKDVNPKGWIDYSDDTVVRDWWKAGGLVGIMWHWQVPANDGVNLTCTPGTKPGETSFDAEKVVTPGTDENKRAMKELKQVAGYLKKLQKAKIPVIWRPYHEAAGNTYEYRGGGAWFWWGAKGAEAFKKLWRFTYDYLVREQQLNNLIWVWTSQTDDHDWYPGDDVVDIVGRDCYYALQYPLMKDFQQLSAQYPTKMVTLAECGNGDDVDMAPLQKIWEQGARFSWFMPWYDASYNKGFETSHQFASDQWWRDAFALPYVITREQMKQRIK